MMAAHRRLLALAVALAASAARAEGYLYGPYAHEPTLATFGWELAGPLMGLRSDFIDATSTTGIALGLRTEVGTRLSAGGELTWNRFRQSSALGDRFDLEAVSLRATIHYYFTGSNLQPYAGFGAGGLYREAVVNAGPTQVGFGVVGGPELGVLFTVGQGLALNLLARYEISSASFDVNGNPAWHVKFPSWLAVQAGIAVY